MFANRGLCALTSLLLLCPVVASAEDIAIIVHPERHTSLEVDDIATVYLKRRRHWQNGDRIMPLNRNAGSDVREEFSRRVFGKDSKSQLAYWNREYFRGVLPPVSLASDEAVLRYVAKSRQAIGYVPASKVDARVRVIATLPEEPVH